MEQGIGERSRQVKHAQLTFFLFWMFLFYFKICMYVFSCFNFHVFWSLFQVRKGDKIGDFLRSVQQQLAPEFREVRTTSVENLLYVKEDLIIPHVRQFWYKYLQLVMVIIAKYLLTNCKKNSFMIVEVQQHSFYELIVNKARGKSGPVIINVLLHEFVLCFLVICSQRCLLNIILLCILHSFSILMCMRMCEQLLMLR